MSDFKNPKYSVAATVEGNVIDIIYVVKLEVHTVLAYHCANYRAWLGLLDRVECIPFVVSFHQLLSEPNNIFCRLQNILDASEEHRNVFKEQPLVAFRHAPILKDNLIRAKLP